jgi:hypothetical protein
MLKKRIPDRTTGKKEGRLFCPGSREIMVKANALFIIIP